MMPMNAFIAADLGAESGRVSIGRLDPAAERLEIKLIRRFPTGILPVFGRLRWNVYRFYEEMLEGMKECGGLYGAEVLSAGFDAWGVDFGLLDKEGGLVELPVSYRDPRTRGVPDAFCAAFPRRRLYELTGVQILELNTLFQIAALAGENRGALERAGKLLFLPDLFNHLFCGAPASEYTIASTSQLLNCRTRTWEPEIIRSLGIPERLLQPLVKPGAVLGALRPEIAKSAGLPSCRIVAVGCHDTASAVAAVPAEGDDWAFISSGTWSLVGVERPEPVVTGGAFEFNLANEGGVMGTVRTLKNVAGLWILRRLRESLDAAAGMDHETLAGQAARRPDFRTLIDPDDPRFFNPRDMAEAIRTVCRSTGQAEPSNLPEFVTAVLSSLALKYRYVLDGLGKITGHPIRKIHIVGGGGRNRTLNRYTAGATGLPVFAGPFEATSVGNLLMQASGLGMIDSLVSLRRVVRNSFDIGRFDPEDVDAWNGGYEKFLEMMKKRNAD
jgi:rhamnulokinase